MCLLERLAIGQKLHTLLFQAFGAFAHCTKTRKDTKYGMSLFARTRPNV